MSFPDQPADATRKTKDVRRKTQDARPFPIGRSTLLIFLLSLAVRLLSAWPLEIPGYFDAYYYYTVAETMVAGHGMVDNVIWNYLDDPAGLPRPSHLYWMPMTTWVAWFAMELLDPWLDHWRATQVAFATLSATLPPLSAWLAWSLWRNRGYAVGAGLLTLFSGFYFIYWSVPDSFTPFAVAVSIAFLAAWRGLETERISWWLLAGIGVGVSHLTRADGVLVGVTIGLALLPRLRRPHVIRHALVPLLAGYLIAMVPWLWRNWQVTGAPLSGAGSKTIWLRSYDEIFSYGLPLHPSRYAAWGILPIVISKLKSLLWNSVVIVGGLQFFLAPFAFIGGWERRDDMRVRLILVHVAVLLGVMILVFTFPSQRGSTLHSTAALVPWLSAFVPAGLVTVVRRIARRRPNWEPVQATAVFLTGFVVLAAGVSLWLYAQSIWLTDGPTATRPGWNQRFDHFEQVDRWLDEHAVPDTTPVFVNDPPAFYGVTGRRAIMLPSNGPAVLADAADRYGARFLVLEGQGASPYRRAYQEGMLFGWKRVARFTDVNSDSIWIFQRIASSESEIE